MQGENSHCDSKARYLVVGASGLIGQAFIRTLGLQAIGTFRSRSFKGGYRFDLARDSIDDLLDRLDRNVTHALLLGGVASIDACARDPRGTALVNVDGIVNAIDRLIARGIVPIVASTDGVYDGSHPRWREEEPAEPILTYGRQKLAVEKHLQRCREPWLALRISKVLDPQLSAQGVLAPWFTALAEGNRIRCAADQRFSPVGVDDVVGAARALVGAGATGTYNVGGAEAVSRLELLETAEHALAKEIVLRPNVERCSIRDFEFAEPRPVDTSLSIEKLQSTIDYFPESLSSICARAATVYAAGRMAQRTNSCHVCVPSGAARAVRRGSILITGVGTVLGHPLAMQLAKSGYQVIGVFRSVNDWVEGLRGSRGIKLVQADLGISESMEAIDLDDCEAVVHLAATSPGLGHGLADMVRDNIQATANLIKLAVRARVSRFVFASSMSVYGQPTEPVVDHRTPIRDPSPYGATKWICEQLLLEVSSRLPSVALRIPALLGKGVRRHWLATVMARARAGDDIAIYNPTTSHNNAVDAVHLGSFVASLLSRQWEGFIALPLGARDALTIEEVVQRIVTGMRSKSRIVVQEPIATSFTIDYSAATTIFGYAPPTMEELLDRFIQASQ